LPGWYWSATTSGHIVFESRLELARLLLADFDPNVVAIATQPLSAPRAEAAIENLEVRAELVQALAQTVDYRPRRRPRPRVAPQR
jgi:hypothetical protein